MSKMFEGDSDYEKIKVELKPFITSITKSKTTPEFVRFKQISHEWNKRFQKAVTTAGSVESVQKLMHPLFQELQARPENRRLLAVLNLYRYLGLVESLGVALLDLIVWLLVANGRDLHVERVHDVPRIVHVAKFKDLDSRNVTLGMKLGFLERNELKKTSKFIDRNLRNDIAHLDFSIDNVGKISTGHSNDVNIYERIDTFIRNFMKINLILTEDLLGKI